MSILETKIESDTDDFSKNAKRIQSLVDALRAKASIVAEGGSAASRKRHQDRVDVF